MMAGVSVVSKDGEKIGFSIATIDRCASEFFLYSNDEVRCLDGRTLHRLLLSDSLVIESEDSLLEMLVALGDNGRDCFSLIEVKFLSSAGIGVFLSELAFDDLTAPIWEKIVSRLTAGDCERFNKNRHRGCFQSTICETIPPILKEFHESAWILLYRGSRDGFAASNFHGKCDGHSNTVSLIETTKGYIFGGFTPVAWESPTSAMYKPDSTQRSFLFTVKNPRGTKGRKFPLTNSAKAICCDSYDGPVFGNGHDLLIYEGCNNSTVNFTSLGGAYENDTGLDGKTVFTGEFNFSVKEIEVYSIRV
jgi:hypothetical protein